MQTTIAAKAGLALFSIRNLGSIADQLEFASTCGVREVETFWVYHEDPPATAALLRKYGLSVPSGQFLLGDFESRTEDLVRTAKTIGMRYLVLAATPEDQRVMSAQGWKELGVRLGEVARALAAQGLGFAYHNHDWEFVRMPDQRFALEHILDGAGENPLLLQIDLGWLSRAKVDIASFASRHGQRIFAIHLKDPAPTGQNADEWGWTSVGAGTLSWSQVLPVFENLGVKIRYIEHDNPKDPREFVRRSLAYLEHNA